MKTSEKIANTWQEIVDTVNRASRAPFTAALVISFGDDDAHQMIFTSDTQLARGQVQNNDSLIAARIRLAADIVDRGEAKIVQEYSNG